MSTSFPNAIDSFANPTPTTVLNQPGLSHADQHANVNDAITAIEAKVGVNLSSITTSLDYITTLFLMTQVEHPSGGYREVVYTTPILPLTVTWYTDNSKLVKLVEKSYTYGGQIRVLPTIVTLTLYNGSLANTPVRVIQDQITYDKLREISRTRNVT